MADLTQRLEASEIEAQRMADALEQMTAQNSALERDVQALQNDNDRLRSSSHLLLIFMKRDLHFWNLKLDHLVSFWCMPSSFTNQNTVGWST